MRIGLWGIVAIAVASCRIDASPVAPPTNVRVDRTPEGWTVVSWNRSPDDGAGSNLVRDYQVLRSASRSGPYVPFAAKKRDGKQPSIVDNTASTDCYTYVVWAIPGRERSTPTERGGAPASSRAVTASGCLPHAPLSIATESGVRAVAPDRDSGETIELTWPASFAATVDIRILRSDSATGPYVPFPGNSAAAGTTSARAAVPSRNDYWFALFAVPAQGEPRAVAQVGPVHASASLFDNQRYALLALLALTSIALFYFVQRARRDGHKMFIRRIPGIDALEEAIGRATEMGRPVLYVPGVEETLSTQTIATVLVLGHVAERVARYGAKLRVSVNFPMTLPLAQEAVKQGYLSAGRPDAYNANDVQWISSEQFAFTAGTNGIILRERPATNIYLGRFYAESLILAETGFIHRAIQIAGTAEIPQLPFFVAACDYTLIGEELYAMSAYLSRQPALLGTLKGGDVVKMAALALLLIGAGLSLGGVLPGFVDFFAPP